MPPAIPGDFRFLRPLGQHHNDLSFLTLKTGILPLESCRQETQGGSMREYARYEGPWWGTEKGPERNQTSNALGWLLLGIGIGAATALLLAPSTGRELRNALAFGYRRTIDGVSRGTRQLRQHGSNLINFTRRSS
jgi:hypothetical protein